MEGRTLEESMSKPVILAIDDDVSVLEAVVQDLRRRYAASYRILRAGSGQAALDLAKQLKQRSESVALFLSDQRMPGMNGTEFLERSIEIFPDAKRALLTAYSDTEAAIRAINAARIHYYLTKPCDPPEEKLYPVIDDLLETWCDTHKAPFEGLRVVGRVRLESHLPGREAFLANLILRLKLLLRLVVPAVFVCEPVLDRPHLAVGAGLA